MSTALSALLIFICVGLAVWLFSFIMEATRPVPQAPRKLRWAPDIPVEYVEVGGNTLRYIKTGTGPVVVLCRPEQHSAGSSEGKVLGGASLGALPRLPEPAAQRGKLADGDQGLRPYRGSSAAYLGRPRLGAALRARA
jgi:hypothetical protein